MQCLLPYNKWKCALFFAIYAIQSGMGLYISHSLPMFCECFFFLYIWNWCSSIIKHERKDRKEKKKEKNWTSLQIINGDDFSVAFFYLFNHFSSSSSSLLLPFCFCSACCLPSPPFNTFFLFFYFMNYIYCLQYLHNNLSFQLILLEQ